MIAAGASGGTGRGVGASGVRRASAAARHRCASASVVLVPVLLFALAGCEVAAGGAVERTSPPPRRAVGPQLAAIPDSTFARLVADLSEPGGYFDTDNLISNESSYLHALDALERLGVGGGAFIGVGPDQGFSYVATIRPAIAFMVDIRRDNLLQHLWFRALFESAASRLDYLCLMVARRCGGESSTLEAGALVERVERADRVPTADTLIDRVAVRAGSLGVPLDDGDLETIRSIHRTFAADGLDLRFNTHGQPPRPYYPTLRRLLLETDRAGREASYLADESSYRVVRELQLANRVIPVVGDLAGPHAVRAIGAEVERRGLVVSAFYVSNVEFYLARQGGLDDYVANLATLPVDDASVLIRSYFNRFRPIDGAVPGYASTQMVQTIPALLTGWEEGRIRGYAGLIAASVTR